MEHSAKSAIQQQYSTTKYVINAKFICQAASIVQQQTSVNNASLAIIRLQQLLVAYVKIVWKDVKFVHLLWYVLAVEMVIISKMTCVIDATTRQDVLFATNRHASSVNGVIILKMEFACNVLPIFQVVLCAKLAVDVSNVYQDTTWTIVSVNHVQFP